MNELTSPSSNEALRVAESAAAEAEPGDVGVTTASCDVICIGVFFDGTNNSREHVGMPGINWHSNVDFLAELYARDAPPTASYKGQMRQFIYDQQYMRGIAVGLDGSTSALAGARGMGEEGVYDRVQEAIGIVNPLINELAAGKRVSEIVLDVFGFSRGAAAARYFANQVQASAIAPEHGGATVRFLGLFDTVSSIYFPGRMTGTSDTPITTGNLHGTTVFHIIAADEMRVNFPLSRCYGTEVFMVGSHSDIGGGRYAPGIPGNGSYDYSPFVAQGLHEWIMEKWSLTGENSTYAANDFGDALTGPGVPAALARGDDRAMFNWSAEHGLQNVSLRIMFDAAKRARVPFPSEVPSSIAGNDVSLHGDLHQYYNLFRERGQCTDEGFADRIRQRYALFPGRNDEVNALEITGQRRELRI